MPHRLVQFAKDSIRAHLRGDSPPVASSGNIPPWGVFVSLHGPGTGGEEGPLRGCVGSLDLAEDVLLEDEVGRVAVSSATADPRFEPLTPDEVDDLVITVYLLDPPEEVEGPTDLDPGKLGIIVTGRRGRKALLLPDLPGLDTAERQLEAAKRKARLGADDEVSIQRFTARIIT